MARFDVKTATNTLGYHERSIVSVFGEIMKDLAAFNIPLDWSFMRADRAQLTLDASLMYLLPGVDYMQLVGEYWRDARTRRVRAAGRMLLRSGGLSGVTEAVGAFVENVEEHRRLGTAALRMQSGLTRRFFGSTMVAIVAGLRMVSALLTVVLIAGAATYVSAGASALLGRLYLESAVSAWRGLPPAIVLLVLVLLVGLRREAISLMSKLYLPQPASLRSRE
jgi:hypothetical protein